MVEGSKNAWNILWPEFDPLSFGYDFRSMLIERPDNTIIRLRHSFSSPKTGVDNMENIFSAIKVLSLAVNDPGIEQK